MTNPNDPFGWLSGGSSAHEDGGLADNQALMMEAVEQRMQVARLVHQVFETPQGIELMNMLYDLTQGAPLMRVSGSLVDGEVALSPSDWAYIREGQNSVTRWLLGQIELAKNPPVQNPEGEEE
tara:strand:- start:12213 stop:12581 length:369 start_codon:yes stop_codon:yes gene_type:complete